MNKTFKFFVLLICISVILTADFNFVHSGDSGSGSGNIFDINDTKTKIIFIATSECSTGWNYLKWETDGFNVAITSSTGETYSGYLPYSIVGSGAVEVHISIYGELESALGIDLSEYIQQHGGRIYFDPVFNVYHGTEVEYINGVPFYHSYVTEPGGEHLNISQTMSYTHGGISFAVYSPDTLNDLRTRQGSVQFDANPLFSPVPTPTPTPAPVTSQPPEPNIPTPPDTTPSPTPSPVPSISPTPTPEPYCIARINISGDLRECRKIVLDSNCISVNSYITDYDWDIAAVSGGSTDSVKWEGSLSGSLEEVIIKQAGTYRITLSIENSAGYSDIDSRIITVREDKPPVADCSLVSPVYRDPADENKASFTITNTSYVQDSDSIGNLEYELFYDSDNDGNLSEHAPVVIFDGPTRVSHDQKITTGVGLYGIRATVTDSIPSHSTISTLLSPQDYKSGESEIQEFIVDNMAPVASYQLRTKKKAFIIVDVNNQEYSLSQVQSKINSVLLPHMNANGIEADIQIRDMQVPPDRLFFISTYEPGGDLDYTRIKCIDMDTLQVHSVYNIPEETWKYDRQEIAGFHPDAFGNLYFIKHARIKSSGDHYSRLDRINIEDLTASFLGLDSGDHYGFYDIYPSFDGHVYYEWDYGSYEDIFRIDYDDPDLSEHRLRLEYYSIPHSWVFSGHNGWYPFLLRDEFWQGNYIDTLSVYTGWGGYDDILYLGMNADCLTLDRNSNFYFTRHGGFLEDLYTVDASSLSMSRVGNIKVCDKPLFDKHDNMYYQQEGGGSIFKYNLSTGVKECIAAADPPANLITVFSVLRNGCLLYMNSLDKSFFMYDPVTGNTECILGAAGADINRSVPFYPYNTQVITPLLPSFSSAEYRNDSANFHVVISSSEFTDIDPVPEDLVVSLLNNSVDFSCIGSPSNRTQAEDIIQKIGGEGTYIDAASLNDAIDNLSVYIASKLDAGQQVVEDNILVGQGLEIQTFYSDYENDDILASCWNYIHHSHYFDNSLGRIPDSGQNRTLPYTVFDLPGLYSTIFQFCDDAKSDSGFSDFDKWSSDARLNLYVDRAPVCDFDTYTAVNGSLYDIFAVNTSYDPDHTSRGDKGIVESSFSHKRIDDLAWSAGFPQGLASGERVLVRLTVRDLEGHTSHKVKAVYPSVYGSAVAYFEVTPNPAAIYESVQITDLSFCPGGGNIDLRHWVIEDMSGNTLYYGFNSIPDITSYGVGEYIVKLRVTSSIYPWYSDFFEQKVAILPDTVPPDIVLDPPCRDYDNTDVSVNITSADNYSGIDNIRYIWTQDTCIPASGWNTAFDSIASAVLSQEGIWYLHAEATDGAGNTEYVCGGPYRIDKTDPSCETKYIEGASYINGNDIWARRDDVLTFSVNGTDNTEMYRIFLLARDYGTNPYRQHRSSGTCYNHNNHSKVCFLNSCDVVNTVKTLKAKFELGIQTDEDLCFRMEGICDDMWGNRNGWNDSGLRLKTDNTKPSGVITADNTGWTSANVVLEFSASDDRSGIKHIIRPDGSYVWGTQCVYTAGSNGTYEFTATDNVGNTEIFSYNVTNIDRTPPEGSYNLSPSCWTTGSVTISFFAWDVLSGVDRIILPDSTVVYSDTALYTANSKGEYSFIIYDRAGNSSQIIAHVDNIDHDLPYGTFTPHYSDWTNSDIDVVFSAEDEGSGIKRWQYRHSSDYGNTYGQWSEWFLNNEGTFTLSEEGYHVLHAWIEDESNNTGQAYSGAYLLDKTPVQLLYAEAAGHTYRQGSTYWIGQDEQLEVRVRGCDAMSNTRYSYIRIAEGDNRSRHCWDTGDSSNNSEFSTSPYTEIISACETFDESNIRETAWTINGIDDIVSPIQYYFTDYAGNNTGYLDTGLLIGVDCTPPSAYCHVLPELYTCEEAMITLTGSDSGSGVNRIRLPDGTWCPSAVASYTVDSNGEYEFLVEDNVGLVTPVTVIVNTIDTGSPYIDCVPLEMEHDDDITATVTGTDNPSESGIDYIAWCWSNQTENPSSGWEYINLDGESSHTFNTTVFPDGTWYLHMLIYDRAGNGFYRCRGPYIISRNSPPEISICSLQPYPIYEGDLATISYQPYDADLQQLDVTIQISDGTGSCLLETSQTVFPQAGEYSIQSLQTGETLPAGTDYTLTVTAEDPFGETCTDTLSFDVSMPQITDVSIEGYWNHWRGQTDIFGKQMTDEPHRFLSLETVKINIRTTGFAERIVIRFSPELESMQFVDPYGNMYDYVEDFTGMDEYVFFPEDSTFELNSSQRDAHVYWEYLLPLADSTVDWDDNRLNPPYSMYVYVYKGDRHIMDTTDDIDITGNVYDLVYIQPLN